MKKLYTLASLLAFGSCLIAQQVLLTYKTHGLAADHGFEMKMGDYVDPGTGGKNQVWDLSSMESNNDFHGFVAPAREADAELHFQEANIVVTEGGTRFFFCQEKDLLTAWGTMTQTGQVLMKYHRPYIKMKYPFAYGDEFSGDYEGIYYLSDKEVPLSGKFSVKADGHGKLILPGNKEVKNALRVVTARSYDLMMENGTQTFKIKTYRWYSAGELFPLAVLQSTSSTVCNPDGDYNYRAFYRLPEQSDNQTEELSKSILETEDLIKIYPNPVKNHFRMEYVVNVDSEVFIELYDNKGSKIAILVDQHKQAGNYSESFSTKKYEMKHGIYHIRGFIGDHISRTTFIRE